MRDLFLAPEEVNHGKRCLLPDHVDPSWRVYREYRVLALDPGGTTGWCLAVVDKSALTNPSKKILGNVAFWSAGEWTGPEAEHAYAAQLMALSWGVNAVVIEDFVLRTLKGGRELLSPVRVTARIEQYLWSWPQISVIKQPSSLAMSTMTDGRLSEAGLWLPGMDHANDATRHCFTWLRRKKAMLQNRKR